MIKLVKDYVKSTVLKLPKNNCSGKTVVLPNLKT